MMFVGSKFCPHCGAVTTAAQPGPATKKTCPRCTVPLQQITVGKWTADECIHCGGLWISVASFDQIVSDAQARTAATGLQLPDAPPVDTEVRYIHCPQCNQLMNRMNYAERSGVVIDICRPHGIWLDRGEIGRITDFIISGGLDRARAIQQEQIQRDRRALEVDRQFGPSPAIMDTHYTHPNFWLAFDGIALLGQILTAFFSRLP